MATTSSLAALPCPRAPAHFATRPIDMPRIVFTPQLRRFTATPEFDSEAGTLRALLDEAFVRNPMLRGYVLDDQGHLRPNVVVFIDGRRCTERVELGQPLAAGSTVHVLQALSGG